MTYDKKLYFFFFFFHALFISYFLSSDDDDDDECFIFGKKIASAKWRIYVKIQARVEDSKGRRKNGDENKIDSHLKKRKRKLK